MEAAIKLYSDSLAELSFFGHQVTTDKDDMAEALDCMKDYGININENDLKMKIPFEYKVISESFKEPSTFVHAGDALQIINDSEVFLQNEIHKCYLEDNDLWDYEGHNYKTAILNNEPRMKSEWMNVYCDNIADIYGDYDSVIDDMSRITPLGAKTDLYHTFSTLDGLYSRIQEQRPDYSPEQCGELVSNIIDHWQERNKEIPLTSEQIIEHLGRLQGHHIKFEIKRFSEELDINLPEHGAMSKVAAEIEFDKTHMVILPKESTEALLSLRKQLSSAIDAIDSVVGKNGQVQQNITAHEKQAKAITQSRKISGPTL